MQAGGIREALRRHSGSLAGDVVGNGCKSEKWVKWNRNDEHPSHLEMSLGEIPNPRRRRTRSAG